MWELLPGCLLVALGLTAGVLAGLLGIGGGMVVVPGLFYIFAKMDFPESSLMHVAAGTAMVIMICTSISSTCSHQAKGDIQWKVFWQIIPGITIGVISGVLLDGVLNSRGLELAFGLFLLVVALKMLFDWQPKILENYYFPAIIVITGVGWLIGFKSGLLGVGGGALSVPFLIYWGLPMHEVVGTSASFTLPISIIGTLCYLLFSKVDAVLPWSTGYIYWPALVWVAPFTMIGAYLGTKLSHLVPPQKLRTLFAVFLLLLSLKMLWN